MRERINKIYNRANQENILTDKNIELSINFCNELKSFFEAHYDSKLRPTRTGYRTFDDNNVSTQSLGIVIPPSEKNQQEMSVTIGYFCKRRYYVNQESPDYYEIDMNDFDYVARFDKRGSIMESKEHVPIPFHERRFGGPPVYTNSVSTVIMQPEEIEEYRDFVRDLTERQDIKYESR